MISSKQTESVRDGQHFADYDTVNCCCDEISIYTTRLPQTWCDTRSILTRLLVVVKNFISDLNWLLISFPMSITVTLSMPLTLMKLVTSTGADIYKYIIQALIYHWQKCRATEQNIMNMILTWCSNHLALYQTKPNLINILGNIRGCIDCEITKLFSSAIDHAYIVGHWCISFGLDVTLNPPCHFRDNACEVMKERTVDLFIWQMFASHYTVAYQAEWKARWLLWKGSFILQRFTWYWRLLL